MHTFYILFYLAVATVMARPELPLFMGLQQQTARALPLNSKPHLYQQLPVEQNFVNFVDVPSNYGVLDDSLSPDILAPTTPEMVPIEKDSYNTAYRLSSNQHHQTGYDHGPTETVVHKHIYVHVPPKDFEEEDAVRPHVTHQRGRKQKHYKIVFIKAPESPAIRAPSVPPLPQSEEKTLIYVLHRKPETQPDIVIPTPEPTKPSKPEVYFIKYKTKKVEAPVYGPPLAFNELETRQADATNQTEAHDFVIMNLSQKEPQVTTQQPRYQEKQQSQIPLQFSNEEHEIYNGHEISNGATMSTLLNVKYQTTTVEPLNQYLPPETTPATNMVKEMEEAVHEPAATYGTPKKMRFFIKKRK